MNNKITNQIVEEIAATIEIPESSYETAEQRYKDFGNWFGRPESKCYSFVPHSSPVTWPLRTESFTRLLSGPLIN